MYSPELVSAQKELAIARELKLDARMLIPPRARRRPPGLPRQRANVWPTGRSQPRRKVANRLTFRSPATDSYLEKKAVEACASWRERSTALPTCPPCG